MDYDGPVLDNHLHLNPESGKGIEAVRDFARVGGTHLLVVNRPSWYFDGVPETASAFEVAFEATIDAVEAANDELSGRAWPVLGVHPGLVTKLVEEGSDPDAAADLMCAGLDRAAERVADGEALALKTGRPHYEVSEAVWDASNRVLRHGLALGAEMNCAVQLHTEATEELTDVAEWAEDAGMDSERVVKHYAAGELAGVTPSVMSEKDRLERAAESGAPFLMETDFVDDPERPGAVLGPKTVPRRVRWLLESGHGDAVRRAHVETPRRVYGIDTERTL